jgi:ABC-2 type transport system ATP-binding protein
MPSKTASGSNVGFVPDEPLFYSYFSTHVEAAMAQSQPLIEQYRPGDSHFAEEYSRGMKKKLGLLLALLHHCKLLILDGRQIGSTSRRRTCSTA